MDFEPPPTRPLKKASPSKYKAAAVNTWIQKPALSDEKKVQLAGAIDRITVKTLSKDIRKNLKDRAADYGPTHEVPASMKDPELVKCVLAAVALSS